MKRLIKTTALMLCLALPSAALSASAQDQIIAQLTGQGFSEFEVSRTWLGRTRIISESDLYWREIVFNPNTGEILRDYITLLKDHESDEHGVTVPKLFSPEDDDEDEEDNSGHGNAEDDDSDDDDDEEDEEDGEDEEDDDDDDEEDD